MKESKKRALRTFIQAFIGFVATNLLVYIPSFDFENFDVFKTATISLLAPAIAAGVAAVMNYQKQEEN